MPDEPGLPDRRAVLGGATAFGATALGATGGCAAPAPGDRAPTRVPAGPPVPDAPASGRVLGAASDVPVGGGTIFGDIVVTQPVAGEYVGLTAVCPHAGCLVDEVREGTIRCPCHGARFRLDGSRSRGPTIRRLAARPVDVVDGRIVVR